MLLFLSQRVQTIVRAAGGTATGLRPLSLHEPPMADAIPLDVTEASAESK